MVFVQKIKRKRILFLSSRLPYPPIGGDRLKNFWLLKILSKHFNIHLVSITEKDVTYKFYSWANEIGITYKIFRKTRLDFILNASRFMFNRLPIQVNYYYFKDIQNYIDSIYHKYDLLFATLIRTAKYVIDKDKPKILDMADSIGLSYKRSAKRTYSKLWKIIYNVESKRLLDFESKCIISFNKTLFVNNEERAFFKYPEKTVWLANGVNEHLLTYDRVNLKYKNHIIFFGKMDYQPNIDAVLWFVKNVLPFLNRNLKFAIVGANPPKKIKLLEKKYSNVIVTGFIEDPYEIIKSSLCVVAPMQTGGGIQNKILESMALGTINIVSSLAAKPIGGKNGEHYFIVDDPEEVVHLINDIYKNSKKYEYIKENARDFIKNNFTWGVYEKKLLGLIIEILGGI